MLLFNTSRSAQTCQKRLAHLSEPLPSDIKLDSARATPGEDSEEALLQRLKHARLLAMQPSSPTDTTIGNLSQSLAAVAATDPQLPIIPGYEIIGVLGRGGMAVVYKARHLALQRIVALKMLRDWACAGERELARFRAEADAIARLQHPNIVQIHSVGEVSGRPYFVLEYVPGGSLAATSQWNTSISSYGGSVCGSARAPVQAAHSSGIIHRDLKPSNILLVFGEASGVDSADETLDKNAILRKGLLKAVPKIADFGVAKRIKKTGKISFSEILRSQAT